MLLVLVAAAEPASTEPTVKSGFYPECQGDRDGVGEYLRCSDFGAPFKDRVGCLRHFGLTGVRSIVDQSPGTGQGRRSRNQRGEAVTGTGVEPVPAGNWARVIQPWEKLDDSSSTTGPSPTAGH